MGRMMDGYHGFIGGYSRSYYGLLSFLSIIGLIAGIIISWVL